MSIFAYSGLWFCLVNIFLSLPPLEYDAVSFHFIEIWHLFLSQDLTNVYIVMCHYHCNKAKFMFIFNFFFFFYIYLEPVKSQFLAKKHWARSQTHLFTNWSCTSHLTSLDLSCLICKKEIKILYLFEGKWSVKKAKMKTDLVVAST